MSKPGSAGAVRGSRQSIFSYREVFGNPSMLFSHVASMTKISLYTEKWVSHSLNLHSASQSNTPMRSPTSPVWPDFYTKAQRQNATQCFRHTCPFCLLCSHPASSEEDWEQVAVISDISSKGRQFSFSWIAWKKWDLDNMFCHLTRHGRRTFHEETRRSEILTAEELTLDFVQMGNPQWGSTLCVWQCVCPTHSTKFSSQAAPSLSDSLQQG